MLFRLYNNALKSLPLMTKKKNQPKKNPKTKKKTFMNSTKILSLPFEAEILIRT